MTKNIKLDEKNYVERDISWMSFNNRVLYQTSRKNISLIERMKFLGISASNLDEFLMVRVSDALTNDNIDLYKELWDKTIDFKRNQDKVFENLMYEMRKQNNVKLVKYKHLNKVQKDEACAIFHSIYPILVPLIYHPNVEFPHIHSKELSILVGFKTGDIGIVPIDNIPRVYELSPDKDGCRNYITSEEIIYQFLDNELFVNSEITFRTTFRILREASITMEDDKNVYVVDRMKDVLRQREISEPIILEIGSKVIPNDILSLLRSMLGVSKNNVYRTNVLIDYAFLVSKPFDIGGDYEGYSQFYPKEFLGKIDIFDAITDKDIVLHHPFDSFDPVIKFISHAADDDNVISIRQTLYRVSSESSPIIEALCRASQRGKDVSVLLEIKARFDEEQNIALVDKLKDSGCKVIYGIEELKTHAKFALVVKKKKKGGFKCYAHMGTGNYNDKTSAIYTDLSLFTDNKKICRDLITIFNILSGKSEPGDKVEKIKFAPYNIRDSIYKNIDREVKNVKDGKKGLVVIKVNSISDPEMVKKIYEASEKGVVFNIICRGICSIKPINKNITIKSVIGRFLEHSRVYYFYNNNHHETFISSADLLTRNLDRRVEILVPIEEKSCRNQISRILLTYLNDEMNSFNMVKGGKYEFPKDEGMDSHKLLIEETVKKGKVKKKEFKVTNM